MVAYRVGLVFYGVQFLPVWYVRLVGHDGRGVRQQCPQGRSLSMRSSFQVLSAPGAVFYIVHLRVFVISRRWAYQGGLIFDDFRDIYI
jgi:hypothetical protein